VSDNNYGEYDSFLQEADKDDRVGDHDFMVESVDESYWPSGDPRFEVRGVLTTAHNASVRHTWSPPPAAAVLKETGGSMDGNKKKAIASAIRFAKTLASEYGKSVQTLKAGDVFRVKTVKTKIDAEGKGGFIRIVAVLPKSHVGKAADPNAPPF
jgi:hypothetical protein